MAPRLRLIHFKEDDEDYGTIKLELYDSKRVYGYLATSYYKAVTSGDWFMSRTNNDKRVFLTAYGEHLQDKLWDAVAFEKFLEQLKDKKTRNSASFKYGGENTGICFFVDEGDLVFGYGSISPYTNWGIGLDTEYRVKLRKHTIKNLEKLHEILRID